MLTPESQDTFDNQMMILFSLAESKQTSDPDIICCRGLTLWNQLPDKDKYSGGLIIT